MTTEQSKHPDLPILFVDDEMQFLQSASFTMRTAGFTNVVTCPDSRTVMDQLKNQQASCVVLDMMMPHVTGEELLKLIGEECPQTPVIMLTAINEVATAVACMKSGAYDYLVKPVDKNRLVTSVKKALESRAMIAENQALRDTLLNGTLKHPEHFEEIITHHCGMTAVFRYIEAVSRTTLPLLVTGETGSGKELIARAFHAATGRNGEFVAVNAAGLDDQMFSDTLFGHEKGAFTGATTKRAGMITRARGGTIFLDEIGDLRIESQVKLLRLIDDKTFYPVGSDIPQKTDVRIVTATNRDLSLEQEEGRFRKDLFYRLQCHHVHLPPLRERDGDIALLTDYFIEEAAKEIVIAIPTVPPQLYMLLNSYHFPGNVRELRGMVFDALSRHTKGVLSLDAFKSHIDRAATGTEKKSAETPPSSRVLFGDPLPTLKEMDSLLVEEALRRSDQNQSIAARMLGITRSALNKRINHA
ncbi:MAG: response regulator [Chitinivibrionales bacterium]|nr:response regulator [Chitinivibrionales bacterium]